jgi:hypothetical protein
VYVDRHPLALDQQLGHEDRRDGRNRRHPLRIEPRSPARDGSPAKVRSCPSRRQNHERFIVAPDRSATSGRSPPGPASPDPPVRPGDVWHGDVPANALGMRTIRVVIEGQLPPQSGTDAVVTLLSSATQVVRRWSESSYQSSARFSHQKRSTSRYFSPSASHRSPSPVRGRRCAAAWSRCAESSPHHLS